MLNDANPDNGRGVSGESSPRLRSELVRGHLVVRQPASRLNDRCRTDRSSALSLLTVYSSFTSVPRLLTMFL